MKQILQSYRSGELWLADVPAPTSKRGGIVVQTAASLVSAGTERMIIELAKKSLIGKAQAQPNLVKKVFQKLKTEGLSQTFDKVMAKLDAPITLGYSCAGIAIEVGEDVSGIKPGDRVACGGAGYATHAEYNFVPKNLCADVPENVSLEDAAFTTLGAIALQGVRQAEVRLGERVVIVGLGLLGLLTVQLLKASGCAVLGSDLDKERCDLARQLGADQAVTEGLIEAALAFTEGYGADVTIITAATKSNQPIETAAEVTRSKGKVVVVGMVGMEVPREPFYKKELDLRLSMSYGPGRYDPTYEEGGVDYPFGYVRWTERRNMQSFLNLVAEGKVTPAKLVTHRFEIDKALEAYELLEGKGDRSQSHLAIVLTYPTRRLSEPPSRKIELRAEAGPPEAGIGLVGAGNFARSILLPALKRLNEVHLIGVCDASGMNATETAKKCGFAYAATDSGELFKDSRINAVFVATQHDSHASLACAAMEAGKNVLVEKPLCIKPEEIDRYKDAVSKAGNRCLMVGFNRRFSRHAEALRETFQSRSTPLFIIYRVNAGVVPRDSWLQDPERGGGRIVGEVCHFVDLCEYLIGSRPMRVSAGSVASNDSRIVPEDSVVITIDYADGSLATIQYLAYGASSVGKERIEVHADGVTAVLDDFRTTSFHGIKRPPVRGGQDKGFDAELAAFLETIKSGGAWPIAFESILRTTRVTFAVRDSLRTGKAITLE